MMERGRDRGIAGCGMGFCEGWMLPGCCDLYGRYDGEGIVNFEGRNQEYARTRQPCPPTNLYQFTCYRTKCRRIILSDFSSRDN